MRTVFKNTLQKGKVRYIVFKEGDTWYAVGLEFNIVESGDDPTVVLLNLFAAIKGYVESFGKASMRPHALNQTTEKEYEEIWKSLHSTKTNNKSVVSPYQIYTYGTKLMSE